MPFNAPAFLYLFLPAVLSLWWRLQRSGREAAAQWAVVADRLAEQVDPYVLGGKAAAAGRSLDGRRRLRAPGLPA